MSDKQVDRINLLLAKAENAATKEEADAYNAKASELMIRYGIEQAMLAAAQAGKDVTEAIVEVEIAFTGMFDETFKNQAWHVSRALTDGAVSGFHRSGFKAYNGEKIPLRLTLIGFESDIDNCKAMIASLRLQCESELFDWWEQNKGGYKYYSQYDKKVARRAFIEGYTMAACQKIRNVYRKVKEEATSQGTGAEVALVDRKKQVDQYMDKFNLGKARARYARTDASGRAAGRAAGGRADVGGRAVRNAGRIGA